MDTADYYSHLICHQVIDSVVHFSFSKVQGLVSRGSKPTLLCEEQDSGEVMVTQRESSCSAESGKQDDKLSYKAIHQEQINAQFCLMEPSLFSPSQPWDTVCNPEYANWF